MYDWLLFFHVLSGFMLVATIVAYTAIVVGAPVSRVTAVVADRLWDVGATGTLVLGIWLALYVDRYDLLDGWVIGAIVLWVIAAGAGVRARVDVASPGAGAALAQQQAVSGRVATLHWLRTVAVLALLVVMIYKPGA